jgi:hypothetical protein
MKSIGSLSAQIPKITRYFSQNTTKKKALPITFPIPSYIQFPLTDVQHQCRVSSQSKKSLQEFIKTENLMNYLPETQKGNFAFSAVKLISQFVLNNGHQIQISDNKIELTYFDGTTGSFPKTPHIEKYLSLLIKNCAHLGDKFSKKTTPEGKIIFNLDPPIPVPK